MLFSFAFIFLVFPTSSSLPFPLCLLFSPFLRVLRAILGRSSLRGILLFSPLFFSLFKGFCHLFPFCPLPSCFLHCFSLFFVSFSCFLILFYYYSPFFVYIPYFYSYYILIFISIIVLFLFSLYSYLLFSLFLILFLFSRFCPPFPVLSSFLVITRLFLYFVFLFSSYFPRDH